jgi:N-acylneuraminate cytidylyltransferase
MKQLAIIVARGGSKRIPRKNIRNFLGKPIIAYSIETALESQLFNEVMVSTDDEEIASTAEAYGAKVPFMRSRENSGDHATTYAAIAEVLEKYSNTLGHTYDLGCCIYPTAPLLRKETIQKALAELKEDNESLSTLPIVRFSFPIQRALKLTSGRIDFVYPEHALTRTQDLEARFHDAGQFYCFNTNLLLKRGVLIDNTSKGIEVSDLETQDIDNESDWKLAELKWRLINSQKQV